MRYIVLIMLFYSFISAQIISMSPEFKKYFKSYKSLDILLTKGVMDSFRNLKDMKSNLAVVRADILFLANKGAEGFKWKEYDLLARTKKVSYLYFVARDGEEISDMSELIGKKISIGKVGDMAGQYLQDILIDEVEFQVQFQSYDLETSLKLIQKKKIDYLFAFGTGDFEKSIRLHSLISFTLPEEFKNILLKNEGFVRTDKSVRADNYVVVTKKLDSSFLKSVIQEFKENKILLREVDSRLGALYPDITKILADIEQEKEKKREKEQKEVDTTLLIAEIDSLQNRLGNTISNIKNKISVIKLQSLKFKKASQQYAYRLKANVLLGDVNVERDSLELKSRNFDRWKKEKDVGALEMLRDVLESINVNLMRYDKMAEDIKGEIKLELLREREREEEKALEEEDRKYQFTN